MCLISRLATLQYFFFPFLCVLFFGVMPLFIHFRKAANSVYYKSLAALKKI